MVREIEEQLSAKLVNLDERLNGENGLLLTPRIDCSSVQHQSNPEQLHFVKDQLGPAQVDCVYFAENL